MGTSSYEKFSWSKWSTITSIPNFIVLDIETTGLSPKTAKIIEVAMVKIIDGKPCDSFSSLIDPQRSISPRITKLTGITNQDLNGAPLFSELAPQIADFIDGLPVLGHNITFDLSFLVPALDACGVHTHLTYLDTLQLARKVFPKLKDHKLETLIKTLSLADGQAHRALDDVTCTLALFNKICELFSDGPLMDAIYSCCTPIENATISPIEKPLQGKNLVLVGAFTFSYSSARRLIAAAGGTISGKVTNETDYLVYGYLDEIAGDIDHYDGEIAYASELREQGRNIQIINEIHLLKLCGVTFY